MTSHLLLNNTRDQQQQHVPIAPLPIGSTARNSDDLGGEENKKKMLYACKICSARKIKCDKILPKCENCRKGGVGCQYDEVPRVRKKRKLRGEVEEGWREKVGVYERILRENDLLPKEGWREGEIQVSSGKGEGDGVSRDRDRMGFVEGGVDEKGRLAEGRNGEVRFVGSRMWDDLDDQGHDEEGDEDGEVEGDVLSDGLVDEKRELGDWHPCQEDAMFLWRRYVERVEPICRVLHIPSTTPLVEKAARNPTDISKTMESLLFAIYHFAILTLTEEECTLNLKTNLSRNSLLNRYNLATRHSLTNASLLQKPSLPLLQSLTLHLLSIKSSTPPQKFWILTGVAIRLAQQLGIHRDGTKLGLQPFETQMRRRIWYQLLPLDLWAGQTSGTGISVLPESWDTEMPWNVNDEEIRPGMIEIPYDKGERKGATEMMFCLVRATLGRAFGAAAAKKKSSGDGGESVEEAIERVEKEVEEKFLRYADVVDPVHFLTVCLARSGVCAMRLRYALACAEKEPLGIEEKKRILKLTQKIVDTDSAATEHIALQRLFSWHTGGVFIWGSWESLIFNLQMLLKGELLEREERGAAWRRVEKMIGNHPEEILKSKKGLPVAIRKLVVRAWEKSPLNGREQELGFVGGLVRREMSKDGFGKKSAGSSPRMTLEDTPSSYYCSTIGSVDSNLPSDCYMGVRDFDAGGKEMFEGDPNFDLDAVDWSFWNQLIQDVQK